ncbi:MAG TPA: YegP family protein [Gaiellaceae bacterium]|nr:YegP family protein [Gaiellaceae bacterium]
MARARFQIYADAAGKFRWRLKDGDGEKVASSGESFDTRSNAKRAAEIVKGTAPEADIDDED